MGQINPDDFNEGLEKRRKYIQQGGRESLRPIYRIPRAYELCREKMERRFEDGVVYILGEGGYRALDKLRSELEEDELTVLNMLISYLGTPRFGDDLKTGAEKLGVEEETYCEIVEKLSSIDGGIVKLDPLEAIYRRTKQLEKYLNSIKPQRVNTPEAFINTVGNALEDYQQFLERWNLTFSLPEERYKLEHTIKWLNSKYIELLQEIHVGKLTSDRFGKFKKEIISRTNHVAVDVARKIYGKRVSLSPTELMKKLSELERYLGVSPGVVEECGGIRDCVPSVLEEMEAGNIEDMLKLKREYLEEEFGTEEITFPDGKVYVSEGISGLKDEDVMKEVDRILEDEQKLNELIKQAEKEQLDALKKEYEEKEKRLKEEFQELKEFLKPFVKNVKEKTKENNGINKN